jgi:tripartite-type tricarboxylate transporter receptor subunit TctC
MAKFSLIIAAAVALLTPCITYPQAYPSRPIRLIVPSVAGGPPDLAARPLASELSKQMGQQVVVDNRPGASGIIAFEIVARAAPDGYTLGFWGTTIATNPSLYTKLPYDIAKDFQPVIHATSGLNLLAITPSLPIRSVKELIDHARGNPGKLSYGTSGLGGSTHLSMELLKSMTGVDIVLVSYKGMPQASLDVISGQIHMVCDVISTILPHVRAGKVRALAVTSLKRLPLAPEVPTFDESGLPGYEITNWGGYAFPTGVPRSIVLQMNAAINKAQFTPLVSKAIADRGAFAVGGTPEQFAEHVRRETEKLGKLIKAAGIKPQ